MRNKEETVFPDTTKSVPFKDVQPGQEFYHQRTLMMRLEGEVASQGEPVNTVALSSISKGRLLRLDDTCYVQVVEKVLAFRRNVP